jgi:hypothetical protein
MAKRGRGFWSQQFTDEDYRERLKSKCLVDPFTGCWIYQGFRNKLGYGDFSYRGVNLRAHRVAYKLWKGDIPAGLDILHSRPKLADWDLPKRRSHNGNG